MSVFLYINPWVFYIDNLHTIFRNEHFFHKIMFGVAKLGGEL